MGASEEIAMNVVRTPNACQPHERPRPYRSGIPASYACYRLSAEQSRFPATHGRQEVFDAADGRTDNVGGSRMWLRGYPHLEVTFMHYGLAISTMKRDG